MEPRWVISMGSCANSGGMYDIYSVVQGVDQVPAGRRLRAGLPAVARRLHGGLLLLQAAVGTEQRPLSWVVGPQGVQRAPRVALRDLSAPSAAARPSCGPRTRCRGPWTWHRTRRRRQRARGPVPRPRAAPSSRPPTRSPPSGCPAERAREVVALSQERGARRPYPMLYDLTAIDERDAARIARASRASDFTVVYHLLSFDRNEDVRLKVALRGRASLAARPSRTSGRPRTGTSAKSGTCSASRFDGHPAPAAES